VLEIFELGEQHGRELRRVCGRERNHLDEALNLHRPNNAGEPTSPYEKRGIENALIQARQKECSAQPKRSPILKKLGAPHAMQMRELRSVEERSRRSPTQRTARQDWKKEPKGTGREPTANREDEQLSNWEGKSIFVKQPNRQRKRET